MPLRTNLLPRVRRLMRHEAARREAQDGRAAQSAEPAPPTAARPPAARQPEAESLEVLEAEARYHRDRLALYRARVYAVKPTSATHLRELEHAATAADARLAHARRASHRSS
jgi:hypothetical protein